MYIVAKEKGEEEIAPHISKTWAKSKFFGSDIDKSKVFLPLKQSRFELKHFFFEITTILGQKLRQGQIHTIKTFLCFHLNLAT